MPLLAPLALSKLYAENIPENLLYTLAHKTLILVAPREGWFASWLGYWDFAQRSGSQGPKRRQVMRGETFLLGLFHRHNPRSALRLRQRAPVAGLHARAAGRVPVIPVPVRVVVVPILALARHAYARHPGMHQPGAQHSNAGQN